MCWRAVGIVQHGADERRRPHGARSRPARRRPSRGRRRHPDRARPPPRRRGRADRGRGCACSSMLQLARPRTSSSPAVAARRLAHVDLDRRDVERRAVGAGERDQHRRQRPPRRSRRADEPAPPTASPAADQLHEQRVRPARRRSVTPHTPATDARRTREPVVDLRDAERSPSRSPPSGQAVRIQSDHGPQRRDPTAVERTADRGAATDGREQAEHAATPAHSTIVRPIHASSPNRRIQ